MATFVVGKAYAWGDDGLDPITVVKRTPKSIRIKAPSGSSWMMRIRIDEDGNEYVVDSTVPKKWKDMYTCSSLWEV